MSWTDRTLAVISAGTLGGSKYGIVSIQYVKAIVKLAHQKSGWALKRLLNNKETFKKLFREADRVVDSAGDLLKGWRKNHRIINVHEAEAINKAFVQDGWKAPYEAGSKVIEFVTKKDTPWIRVHSANNQVGGWIIKKDAIRNLSPDQIRHKYALPKEPIFVSDVHVPSGTKMHRGHVRYIQWDDTMRAIHPEGAIQYQLQDRIPISSFKNARELGGIFQ